MPTFSFQPIDPEEIQNEQSAICLREESHSSSFPKGNSAPLWDPKRLGRMIGKTKSLAIAPTRFILAKKTLCPTEPVLAGLPEPSQKPIYWNSKGYFHSHALLLDYFDKL